MGNKSSLPAITDEMLDDYITLTYLSRPEILYLLKRFHSIGPREMDNDFNFRFFKENIMGKFPVLKFNPFGDRIFHVFSSQKDNCFSFEDILDLCSVMSEHCPSKVKAAWAFKIFDLDDDNQINLDDLCEIIDRLTWDRTDNSKVISNEEKVSISKILLHEIDLEHKDNLGPAEFYHLISKMPEFKSSFYFKI
ncbi:calcium and integrin-binding protein 1-like [Arctopsyche grandis]|uniref:calcium and integrin-binding protein 1-like n=1 Tax=Arctopsyche grandis TaxID=121162 RepID=UPI00406D7DC1